MKSGDVLLLEAQTTSSTMSGYLPVEVRAGHLRRHQYAIRAMTPPKLNKVFFTNSGTEANEAALLITTLNRNSNDFQNSGSIMVGAASSSTPHSRSGFSNYGSRIDCYGWGDSIDTTGDGWTGNSTNAYTTSLEELPELPHHCRLCAHRAVLAHQAQPALFATAMRSVLSSANLNTPSADPPPTASA
jgi:hypothetical protein